MSKQTKLNQKANKKLKEMFISKEITWCELCGNNNFLTFAHRHKRDWYKGKSENLLYSYNQVLLLCIHCHQDIEYDKTKTINVFLNLRGIESF